MAGNKNSGRTKGAKNKLGAQVKETFAKAFHELQKNADSKHNLVNWAKANPDKFYPIAAKFIPLEVMGEMEHRINAIEVVRKE